MDAITLLRNDHAKVRELFAKYRALTERAHKTKQRVVRDIIRELSVHAEIEEQIFYPSVRDAAGETEDQVLESLEEHHIVKWSLDELEKMDPSNERFDAKVHVLIENVTHHIKEEEGDLFKRVRRSVSRAELDRLGDAMAQLKKTAPRRPHPLSPDTPPMNVVASPAAALMDAGREAASAGAELARSAIRRRRSKA